MAGLLIVLILYVGFVTSGFFLLSRISGLRFEIRYPILAEFISFRIISVAIIQCNVMLIHWGAAALIVQQRAARENNIMKTRHLECYHRFSLRETEGLSQVIDHQPHDRIIPQSGHDKPVPY